MAEAKKEYKYLVVSELDDGKSVEEFETIMTAREVFALADKLDCYPNALKIDVWRINGIGQALSECTLRGKWHDPKDPQKMVIFGDGIRETGYGTEH